MINILIILVVITYIVFFTFGFISYAFNSYGLYEIAKKEDEKNAFISWIPYINKYILGRVAFKSNIQATLLVILNLLGLAFTIAMLFISTNVQAIYILSIISLLISTITSVYIFVARYKVYKKYSKSTIIMTILDVISCGILGPFFIFAIRNNEKNN